MGIRILPLCAIARLTFGMAWPTLYNYRLWAARSLGSWSTIDTIGCSFATLALTSLMVMLLALGVRH